MAEEKLSLGSLQGRSYRVKGVRTTKWAVLPSKFLHFSDMSTIADMPPEILSTILELSCTDRAHAVASERPLGFTLGLVCKSFRRATQSCGLDIRYAYVCTVEKMRLFLALLQRRSRYARRVWSLMLAESEMIGEP